MRQGRFTVVMAALFAMQPLFAGVCAVQSAQKGCISLKSVKYMAGDSIDGCEEATVTCPVVLCFVNKIGQTLCRRVESSPINFDSLGNQEESKAFLQIVKAIFSSEPQTYYGGKRLKDTERVPGLPYGEMLMPETALGISSQDPKAGALSSFELKDESGRSLARLVPEGADKVIRVPPRYLSSGKRYQWSAQLGGQTFTGKFSVTSQTDQQDFEQELDEAVSQSNADQSTRYVLRAVLAKEYGFTFDMRQAIEKAKEVMNKGGR